MFLSHWKTGIFICHFVMAFCESVMFRHYIDGLPQNYSSSIKPRINRSHPVEVHVKLHLTSVKEISEKYQTFSFSAWLAVTWVDDFLILADGIESLSLSKEEIWIPDVSLYNSIEDPQHISDGTDVILLRDGHVKWYPGRPYTVQCPLDIRRYPFDEHTCVVNIGAWQATTWSQIFVADDNGVVLKDYKEHGEWDLVKVTTKSILKSEYNVSMLTFSFHFKRRPSFAFISMVVPIILLSTLNTLVFRLPAESGEKMTMCISLLLAFTVFLTMFNETMPRTSTNMPYLSIYIGVQLAMSVFSIVGSIQLWRLKSLPNKSKQNFGLNFLKKRLTMFTKGKCSFRHNDNITPRYENEPMKIPECNNGNGNISDGKTEDISLSPKHEKDRDIDNFDVEDQMKKVLNFDRILFIFSLSVTFTFMFILLILITVG